MHELAAIMILWRHALRQFSMIRILYIIYLFDNITYILLFKLVDVPILMKY